MGKVDIDSVLHSVKMFSVAFLLVSIGCTGAGVMTLRYSAPDIKFPYSTGSGVWCGVCTFVIAVLGLSFSKHFDLQNPQSTKCRLIAMYTLVIMDMTFGILHLSYSAVGYAKCNSEIRTGEITCNIEERPRLILLEAFNVSFGLFVAVLSIIFTIYISVGRKLVAMTGTSDETAYVPCCCGHCNCVVGPAYG